MFYMRVFMRVLFLDIIRRLTQKKKKKTIMMNSNVMAHFFKRISSDSRLAKDAALRMPNRFEREGNIMINDSNVMWSDLEFVRILNALFFLKTALKSVSISACVKGLNIGSSVDFTRDVSYSVLV